MYSSDANIKSGSRQTKKVLWFSAGATSAVACKLALTDNCTIMYFDIGSAHPDNDRFIKDCEKWYGQEIVRLSGKYKDQFDVIAKTKYVNGAKGARCTGELKRKLRESVQDDFDVHVFGFEATKKEEERAARIPKELTPEFPLIEKRLTKENCLGILKLAGIEIPEMYKLGYSNNNPCTLDTKILTSSGVKIIGEIMGTTVSVLTRDGFEEANIFDKGTQEVLELELFKRGLPNIIERFTLDHKFYDVRRNKHKIKRDGSAIETKDLKVDDFIPFNTVKDLDFSFRKDMFIRGFCYGDGSVNGNMSDIRIFGTKKNVFDSLGIEVSKRKGCYVLSGLPKYYKTNFIEEKLSIDDKASFLSGLFAADGNVSKNGVSSLSTSKNYDKYIKLLNDVGIAITSIDVRKKGRMNGENSNGVDIVNRTDNYSIVFRAPRDIIFRDNHISNFKNRVNPVSGWKVKSIKNIGYKRVACATVIDGKPEFTLSSGLLVGNCIGCVKGGAGYWNKIRIDFPEYFERMAKLEREVGRSCLKDDNGRIFLDELAPTVGNMSKPLVPECGFFCGDEGKYI